MVEFFKKPTTMEEVTVTKQNAKKLFIVAAAIAVVTFVWLMLGGSARTLLYLTIVVLAVLGGWLQYMAATTEKVLTTPAPQPNAPTQPIITPSATQAPAPDAPVTESAAQVTPVVIETTSVQPAEPVTQSPDQNNQPTSQG